MLVLGIDLGTSSCKCILVNQKGEILKVASKNYPLITPNVFCYEQNPEDWWQATIDAIQQVMIGYSSKDVAGIGLSGQMSGLVLLDQQDKILRPAILWNDGRSQKECEFLYKSIPYILNETGNYPISGLVAPKLLWIQKHEPMLWKKVESLMLPKDYLRFRLTGEKVTDVSDASLTLLFNVKKRTWSPTMLEICNINKSYLGSLIEGNQISGRLSYHAAKILNLKAGIPIVGGAGDQPAAALGVGCISENRALISLGTSGVVLNVTDKYKENNEKGLNHCCHALPNLWYQMGVMLSAAGSLQWYRDTFAADLDFSSICEAASGISPGSEDLLFMPYLTGERTPYCDPYLRGAFIGLTRKHTQAHLSRAVLEGIGMGLYQSLELIEKSGGKIKRALITGTGTQSKAWMQILANIFNITLLLPAKAESASALGAARLALIGCFGFSPSEVCKTEKIAHYFEPQSEPSEIYKVKLIQFKKMYFLLKEYSDTCNKNK